MDLIPVRITCPYCWEQIEILTDPSVSAQEYTEDCSVCCRPIVVKVRFDGELPTAEVERETD